MFAKSSQSLLPAGSRLSGSVSLSLCPQRFASDKAIRTRMVAVGNIKKITKAMKMVASAKLRRCEEALNISRGFAAGFSDFFPPETVKELAQKVPNPETPAAELPAPVNSYLVVAITPDRGLCGSVSGSVNRATKARIHELEQEKKDVQLVVFGEKARASLERAFAKNLVATVSDHSKLKRRTFRQTADLASLIVSQKFEKGEIVVNQFKNLITFETAKLPLLSSYQTMFENAALEDYDLEGNVDCLDNFYEFSIAARLGAFLAETDMVEYSQRVNSMGNSSKSAEEMLARLRLLYNRSRQAKITTELVEIISGASAADDQKKEK